LRTPVSTMWTGRGESSGQADPLGWPIGDFFEAFERHRQVRTAFGGGHRVDLVDDHGLDALERLAGPRSEHEVERFGGGDQQVRRTADQLLAVVRRRVARAHRHFGRGERLADALGREFDARQRCAEVLLDVECERAQRRDVEHPRAVRTRLGPGRGDESVDRREERGQRLARAGRRTDQSVLAGGDVWPSLDLRRRGFRERRREPLANGRRERPDHPMVCDQVEATDSV